MPKNMILRLGIDASDFKKKMEQAGVTAENTGKRIKKSMTMGELGSEVANIMGWSSSPSGITGAINAGNAEAARSQLKTLTSYRDMLADVGFDDYQFGLVSERIQILEYELNAYEATLQRTADAEREAAAEADNLGSESLKAKVPISNTSRELREMSGSGRKLSIIPGFLRNIRDSADGSNGKLEKMVRTIRNVSVVSLGLRLVRGLFGELGTIVRQHVSENAALQAQVNSLKSSLGQALAPAINIVTNALSALMPYIVGVSNAIGSLISNLFGSGWTTVAEGADTAATAISGASNAQKELNRQLAGFDEITKLNAESSSGGGGGSSAVTTPAEGTTPSWLTNLSQQIAEAASAGDFYGIGSALAGAINTGINSLNLSDTSLGSKIAGFINATIEGVTGLVETTDWKALGSAISTNISDMLKGIDWAAVFNLGAEILEGIGEGIIGLLGDDAGQNMQKAVEDAEAMGLDATAGIGFAIGQSLADLFGFTANADISIDAEANFTTWKDSLKDKITSFKANFTTWKEGLKSKVTTFKANFTTWKESLKNKVTTFKANFTTWKEGLKNKVTTFKANFTTWKSSLKDKVTTFKANFTTWKSSLKDKVIAFQAKMTTWKDNLKEKALTFSANVKKGWTGTLASKLGISSITSKLSLKVPSVSINWGEVTALGKTFKYPKGFDIKWNAMGAILNGAQIFGRIGNTFLGGGEAGREAVLPLDRNTWWMDDIADRVVSRLGGSPANVPEDITVNVQLDGKILASTVVRIVNAQARATGTNPLAAYL